MTGLVENNSFNVDNSEKTFDLQSGDSCFKMSAKYNPPQSQHLNGIKKKQNQFGIQGRTLSHGLCSKCQTRF